MAPESDVALIISGLFGDPDLAREYLTTPNFALGGRAPAELLQTEAGQRQVLSELQAHLDCGPP